MFTITKKLDLLPEKEKRKKGKKKKNEERKKGTMNNVKLLYIQSAVFSMFQ